MSNKHLFVNSFLENYLRTRERESREKEKGRGREEGKREQEILRE